MSILKSSYLCNAKFPNISLYIGSAKSRNFDLLIFRCFSSFGLFFGPFLGTIVKNAKHEKVAPGIFLNFREEIIASIFWSQKCVFGAPIESTEPGMVSS